MADKKTVDVELGLVKGQGVESALRQMSRAVGELIGQFDRAEDEATNAFEVEIVQALGRSKQAAVQLTKQFQDVNREIRATLASLNDLQSFRRGVSVLRSGGAQTETDLAALQGARNQIKNNAFSNQVSMENALNKAYEDRLRIFRQFAHPDAQNGSRVLGIGTSAATSQTRITQPQQLKNAKDFLRAMGMDEIPHYVTDPTTGKRSTNPALREWAAEVERMRQAYIRDQIRVDQEMFAERAKSRREEMEMQRRELSKQRSRGVQQARQSIQAEMSGIMSAPTDAERRSRFDDAVARAKAAAGTTVAPRIIDRNAERMWELAEIRRGAKVQRAADTQVTGGSIDPASRSVAATLDRFNFAGGAGVFAIQGRLLANYAAMSAVMSSLSFLGRFTTELEQGLAQVQAIAAATDSEMQGLEKTILSVAKNSRFTATEVASAATLMAQAGLSVTEISKAIGPIKDLAVGTGTDLANTVDIVTSVLAAFQLQTSETANVANTLTAAMNQSKLGIQQFQLGVQYAGNTASDAGITYNELAAALGGMANAGIKAGSTLGTGLRQLLVDLQAPTEKANAVYERLGLTFSDLDVKSQGLFGVLRNLRNAGFGSAEAFEALEVRAAAAYSALVNDLPSVEQLNREIIGTNAASEAAADQMDTMSSRAIQFQNTLGAAVYEFSKPLQEILKTLLQGLTWVIDKLTLLGLVFQIAFSAGVGAAVVYIVKGVVELSKGLAALPQLLQNARTQIAANTAATNAATAANNGLAASNNTVATTAAAAATTTKISWLAVGAAIGGSIGIIFAAASAFDMLSRAVGWHTASLDELESALNKTRDELNTNKQGLDAVQAAIQRVSDRSANLTEGSADLSDMVAELNSRFGEFGLQMIDNAKNATDLKNALFELETQMLAVRRLQLQQEEKQTTELRDAQYGELRKNTRFNMLYALGKAEKPPGISDSEWAMIQGISKLPKGFNGNDPRAWADITLERYNRASSARNFLENQLNASVGATDERKKSLEVVLGMLVKVLEEMGPATANAGEYVRLDNKLANIPGQRKVLDVVDSTLYKGAEQSTFGLKEAMDAAINEVRSSPDDVQQKVLKLKEAAGRFNQPVAALREVRNQLIKNFAAALGVSEAEGKVAFENTDLSRKMQLLFNLHETDFQNDDFKEVNKKYWDQLRDTAKSDISRILTQARGQRRVPFDQALADLRRASASYTNAVKSTEEFTMLKPEKLIDGTIGAQAMDRILYANKELENEVISWEEQLRQFYDMKPRGAGGSGERTKKKVDEELLAVQTKIRKLEAVMRTLVGSVDSQSSLEEVQGVQDQMGPLQDEWSGAKQKERELKIEKMTFEDPDNYLARVEEINDDFNTMLEEMMKSTDQKLIELAREIKGRIEKKAHDAKSDQIARSLDSYLGSLRIFSEDQLDQAVLYVNAQLDLIAEEAGKAFDADPNNSKRLLNPEVIAARNELINGIKANKSKIFRSLLDSYDAGLPADISRDADAAQLRYDQHVTRLQYYGLPTSGLAHVNRAIGSKRIAAAEASVQAATEYKDKLALDRKAIEDAMVGASGDQLQTLKDNLAENNKLELEANNILMDRLDLLEQVKMKYFDMSRDALDVSKVMTLTLDGIWGGLTNGLADAIAQSFQGMEDMDKAFQNLGISILRTLEQMAAQILADQILMWILDIFFPGAGSTAGAANAGASSAGRRRTGGLGNIGAKRNAMGGENPNRDSILALLAPGEGVLSKPAMDVLGQDQFRKLNSRGNRLLNETAQRGGEIFQKREPDEVNVYLVQKDSIPPMTKKDVVMAIGQDILESGQTKRLIKQVVMGKV